MKQNVNNKGVVDDLEICLANLWLC